MVSEQGNQSRFTFETIREQRGMHCMWDDISDIKETSRNEV